MCENVNINVSETNETINIVSSEIQEVIDINVFETTEDVTLNITEEIIQVNINKVTAAEQIQSDWNETDVDALDFIKNKPTSTSDFINDGEDGVNPFITEADVTPQVNSDWNATTGVAEILNKPTIPAAVTKTSDLTNDGEDGINPFITAADIPPVTGFVPYTGATENVDLGTHTLSAKDLVINHSSGSGVAASITKGGAGEALTINKTSGSGNAMSVTGGVTQLSELHLTTDLADAYIASAATWNGKFTLPALTSGSVLFSNGTTIAQDNSNLFWDDTNNRLGIGTATPSAIIHSVGSITASGLIARGNYLQPTLVAAANNDVLVGLDIAPTFTLGAFTGVSRFPLRIRNAGNTASVFGVSSDGVVRWGNSIESGNSTGQLSWDTDLVFINGALNLGFRTGGTDRMRIFSNGNIAIGTATDAGFKLDVNGTARVIGTTTITPAALTGTAATSALDIAQTWNTTGTPSAIKLNITDTASNASSRLLDLQVGGASRFSVTKTGTVLFGNNFSQIIPIGTFNSDSRLQIIAGQGGAVGDIPLFQINTNNPITSTSTNPILANLTSVFSPTSGNANYSNLRISPQINQTGGANGITRGLYIIPTLTAAADWRAIEVTAGITVLAPSVTARASLRIPSGTAPTSPTNGDIWFDGTNLNVRIGGITRTIVVL
jgi:hypothetical protein